MTLDETGPGPATGSAEWWLRKLSRRLDDRLAITPGARAALNSDGSQVWPRFSISRWEAYYRGELNMALTSAKWRAEFAARFPGYAVNFMGTVVDNHRARLQVQGIRFGDNADTDRDAWDWWQDNHMDAEGLKLNRETLSLGMCYALVWPNEDDVPEISIESAKEVVVATAPGKAWKRLAALKRFVNDDGRLQAEVYLPDGIFKYVSVQKDTDFSSPRWYVFARWKPLRVAGEDWPIENPIGIVPIVPFAHKPDLLNEGESKIKAVASNQDAVNVFRMHAFVSAEFASFRQRWAIGMDIPVDPLTGKPIETLQTAVDRLWRISRPSPEEIAAYGGNVPQVQFGEFEATDLAPYYKAIDGEIQMIGAVSHTPYHMLVPQAGQPPSADSIRSSESGLIEEVLDDMVNLGESYEELFRLKFLFEGDARGEQRGAELVWRDPHTQSESQHIDSLVKQLGLGVPELAIWEQMQGVTQSTIRRWRILKEQQKLERALDAPPAPAIPAGLASPGAVPNPAAPLIPTNGRTQPGA